MTGSKKHPVVFTGQKWRRLITVSCVWYHTVALSPINYPRFPLITQTSWQDVPGRMHSPSKALFPAFFLKDTSCPLSTEGNWTSLFHGEKTASVSRERVCVKWDRCVWACMFSCFGVIVMHFSESADDRQQIREAEARWLMPALSDWQRWTYHCFSSPASSVINLICLVLKVEAPLSATRSCSLKSILKSRVIV